MSAAVASPPFAILGIDHVVLRSPDRERLVRFYADVLGCAVVWDRPALGLTHLRAGRALIDIVDAARRADRRPPDQMAPNVDHMCLIIEPFDGDALRRHLAAHGVTIEAPADRFGAEGEGPSVYLRDPEGNTVELKGPGSEHPVRARPPQLR
ncbi:MAG: VOC family protein [Alphaproteobacteria bacterium]|nr:VOC family protein [Alphaproteobacteria bacterium]